MLVDVTFRLPDPTMAMVLGVISERGPLIPKRISEGMYLSGHWSIDQLGLPLKEKWGGAPSLESDIPTSGVCDSPAQVLLKFPILREHPSKFFISFVRLRKEDEPSEGGWRWHKWGEYIGNHEPQCEYLHDEPLIDEVYTFSIYELND